MPRDYAKQSTNKRPPLPGWVWLAGGLFIGLFVALLVYLDKQPDIPAPPMEEVVDDLKKKTRDIAAEVREELEEAQPADGEGPRFDFYHILPELEVPVPETELAEERAREGEPAAQPKPKTRYLLQAGSFRDYRVADRLKASLALLGLQARIQTVTINKTDTWHRVRVGPFDSVRELGKARKRLQDNGIQPIVLKLQN
ncbi:MAG TPA: SPOR domain-containing protein [Gammaproteobacteria bacterium]|nr:SPOR domain-containing protein [Gammaproteobacteria bacterium]